MGIGLLECIMVLDLDTFEIIKGHAMLDITYMNPEHKDEAWRDIIHAVPMWLCGEERVRKVKISELDKILDKGVTVYWEYNPGSNKDTKDEDWKKRNVYMVVYYTMGKVDGVYLTYDQRQDIWDRVRPQLAARIKEIIEKQKKKLDEQDKAIEDEIKWEQRIQSQKRKQLEEHLKEMEA
jgi:hypothetical protein